MNHKYIITGAPGTGKTAIINALKKEGHSCAEEISRTIITQQIASGGDALPWKNLAAFSQQVIALRKAQHTNAPQGKTHFFDRGIIDVIAYLRHDNLAVNDEILEMVKKFPYNTIVFYTPIWEEIYVTDTERKEDILTAKNIEKVLLTTYQSFGYTLVEVPKLSVSERTAFILSKLK
ncbi:AAA family ATPase [Flavobacteriales bacterium]|jgi:predicted ATPase|nr:AAA family ATPase [Flavobacteriales bacterium]MDG1348941.1 AAA family ATPase [Flavobacteriales bacterium]|tara:strand:+ start:3722 stop:4252 length:531 start_codon:yes stop_codon:yes gene_type:complete